MVFSSFTFLSLFLPLVVLLHSLIRPTRVRNWLLMAASVFFYAFGEPLYVLLLLGSAVVNYLFGLGLGKKRSKGIVALAVMFNLSLLFFFKYVPFLVGEWNKLVPALPLNVPQLTLPIGISFYTFQILSYVIDVYRGEVRAQRNFVALLLYISFFPQLIAGPIVKYHDIQLQMFHRNVTPEKIKQGIFRFCCGLGKKILLANTLALAADTMYALPDASVGILSAWLGALAYLFQIYFDFSGYSDMAIGLGQMFGFRFKENFNYPYVAVSVQDFWRRWHISLSTWFREYLYIPLGGNRKGSARTLLNLFIVFAATGIWHGANWTFLVWGLYHGLFLILERVHVLPSGRKAAWLTRIYAFFVALFGWVLFRADTLEQAWVFVRAMFGGGAALAASYTAVSGFFGPYYLVILCLSFIGATPLIHNLTQKLVERTEGKATAQLLDLVRMLGCLALVWLCFMQLASDSYNPFIYFRF